MRPLSADGLFQCRDTLRTNLMNDAAKLLDLLTEPSQLFFAYLVMPGIARLGVGFLQFLKPCALAACVFGTYAVKTSAESFGERPQKADVVFVRRIECQE